MARIASDKRNGLKRYIHVLFHVLSLCLIIIIVKGCRNAVTNNFYL